VNGPVVGLIPARGGSKGIPRKNVKPLAGKPLIAWTVQAALASRRVDRVIVSTEDAEIAAVARECGAETPFRRPPELARDDTPGDAVVLHAIEWLCRGGATAPEYVMLLQPTCPLREARDIDGAVDLARQRRALAVVSVVEVCHHPCYARLLGADGRLMSFLDSVRGHSAPEPTRRQDLPRVYTENGAVFLAQVPFFMERRTFFGPDTLAYVMPPERSLDIDSEWTFRLADLLLLRRRRESEPSGAVAAKRYGMGTAAHGGGKADAPPSGQTADPAPQARPSSPCVCRTCPPPSNEPRS
jgi:CMP-N-acetylneuraminic acid synthetase